MIPFPVAMPNRVMKPTSEAIDSVPAEIKTITTPPIKASGRLAMTRNAERTDFRAMYKRRKIPAMATWKAA
jgi:hypothetical protein